jgi:uracil-DNA glycosylase family 4
MIKRLNGSTTPEADLSGAKVPGAGVPHSALIVVGERPGKIEAMRGEPFCGPDGQLLDTCWRHADIPMTREQAWVTNLVDDFQDYGHPEPDEIEANTPRLIAELVGAKWVMAVGAFALRWFLGDISMDLAHGIPHWWKRPATEAAAIVVPVLHPGSAIYSPEDLATTWWDMQQMGKVMRGEIGPPVDQQAVCAYYVHPTDISAVTSGLPVAVDTEGSVRNPWGYSYTQSAGYATVASAKQITPMRGSCLLLHNSPHDWPVLEALNVDIEGVPWDDTMYKAYNLPGIHRLSLKDLAYRLCGMAMQEYEEVMGEAANGLAIVWLEHIPEHLRCLKEGKGWTLGRRVDAILKDYAQGFDTLPAEYQKLSVSDRWDKVVEDHPDWLQMVTDAIGPIPESTLDDIPEEVAIRYAGRDADATLRINPKLDALLDEWGTRRSYELDKSVLPALSRMVQVGVKMNADKLRALAAEMTRRMEELRAQLGINPRSGLQVAKLLFDDLGIKHKKLTPTGQRMIDNRLLESIRHQCWQAGAIADYREYGVNRDNFCTNLLAAMDRSGRIHPDMGIFAKSGRFTCKAPNMLGLPVLSDVGILIRDAVEADEGRILGEWDYSQQEIRWLAHLSQDPKLCRAYFNKEDVHANTAAEMFGIPLGQVDELKHRFPAKRVTCAAYGGITEDGVLAQMDRSGANSARARAGLPVFTLEDTKRMITEWFRIYPGAARFMEECRAEARRFGYVRDYWGRVTLLPGVWSNIGKVRAHAERQAPSYHIQGGAAGQLKRAIAALWPWFERWRADGIYAELLLPVHDALLCEFADRPDHHIRASHAAFDVVVAGEMDAAVELRVPVVAKGAFGRTWKETKK